MAAEYEVLNDTNVSLFDKVSGYSAQRHAAVFSSTLCSCSSRLKTEPRRYSVLFQRL